MDSCPYYRECLNNILCNICSDYSKLKLKRIPEKRKGPLKNWQKAERKVQKKTGGRLTPSSGALGIKGDIQTKEEVVEVKSSSKSYITLCGDWLDGVEAQAKTIGKEALLVLSIKGNLLYVRPVDIFPCKYRICKKTLRVGLKEEYFQYNNKFYGIRKESR